MALYQNGDESAFKELYSRHSAKIYAYLKKRLRKEEIVKDTYQEVFMKINLFHPLVWTETETKKTSERIVNSGKGVERGRVWWIGGKKGVNKWKIHKNGKIKVFNKEVRRGGEITMGWKFE